MGEYYKENDINEQVKMDTDEDKEFYYFKLHDYDHNNKLDGLEITAAIMHIEEEYNITKPEGNADIFSEDMMKQTIEEYLKSDDINEDGFIDFYEFKQAQARRKEEQV